MANTTKKKASTAKAAASAPEEAPAKVPKKLNLEDTMLVSTQSNTHGKLVYINQRTGDKTEWQNFGDIQTLSVADLRAMRGSQRKFFENNWIFIKGIEEDGYEDVEPAEIYKALNVSQYYTNAIDPDHFDEFFQMSGAEMRRRISMMSAGAKLNLVVATNDAIRDGRLDSLQKIKVIEDALHCELLELK